jgi:hypothetical protein
MEGVVPEAGEREKAEVERHEREAVADVFQGTYRRYRHGRVNIRPDGRTSSAYHYRFFFPLAAGNKER